MLFPLARSPSCGSGSRFLIPPWPQRLKQVHQPRNRNAELLGVKGIAPSQLVVDDDVIVLAVGIGAVDKRLELLRVVMAA
jgi:hypothetical protein